MSDSSTLLYERLKKLAHNFWWTWQPEVTGIFRDLDPALWQETNHNPIQLLQRCEPEKLVRRARESHIESRVLYALRRLEEYLQGENSYGMYHAGPILTRPVAYFSAEFGIHESLPVYAGGLGILAGDHLKSASDLGVPVVGIGLFYVEGYFRQSLDASSGEQLEAYGETDVNLVPMKLVHGKDDRPLMISVETPSGALNAQIWRTDVGRSTLILLDTNVEGNSAEDRKLTARLYGGDNTVRLRQEILLGVGGMRALKALGIETSVIHMNEGHSALAPLELVRQRMHDGHTFEHALREVSMGSVFTTHTPVPAGHDRFSSELIDAHLGTLRDALGLSQKNFLALGRVDPEDDTELFTMTVLALKTSRHANGVSALHGHVSRHMWHNLFPDRPEQEVPIGHITNGVHTLSWIAPQMYRVYERHLAHNWINRIHDRDAWAGIKDIDGGELWEAHQVMRSRLVDFVRRRSADETVLDPNVLTLGFARRFATYKRATLLLGDLDRLDRLVNDPDRPVQILFAGKAHPADEPGQGLIQQIHRTAGDPRFKGKIAFIEDYDIGVGRSLVQGVDAWVNNPRRPLEACGTSGQKVVLNGALNISVLDGWWAEAYDGTNGFAIGGEHVHADVDIQDQRDFESLYRVLEDEVVPLFYDRDASGVPRGWVRRIKRSITTLSWRYSADRMFIDYLQRAYLPAAGAVSAETIK